MPTVITLAVGILQKQGQGSLQKCARSGCWITPEVGNVAVVIFWVTPEVEILVTDI